MSSARRKHSVCSDELLQRRSDLLVDVVRLRQDLNPTLWIWTLESRSRVSVVGVEGSETRIPGTATDITEYRIVALRVVPGSPMTIEEIGADVPASILHRFGHDNSASAGYAGSLPSGEAIVLDLDGDSDVDALVPTFFAELLGLEWQNGSPDTVVAEAGWPMLFGDLPHTPCAVDMSGMKGLLVSGRDKTLHFLERQASVSTIADWPQYGRDSRNTGSNVPIATAPRPGVDLRAGRLDLSPMPLRAEQTLRFQVPRKGRVSVGLFDVSGRRVRNLLDRATVDVGVHVIEWNGKDDRGHAVAAGVYFYRVAIDEEEGRVLKTVVIR